MRLILAFNVLFGRPPVVSEAHSFNLVSFGSDFLFNHSDLLISGINIIAVGITDSIDAEFLRLLSGPGMSHTGQLEGKDYFKSPDFLSLNSILGTLVTSACATPDPSASRFFYFLAHYHFVKCVVKTVCGDKTGKYFQFPAPSCDKMDLCIIVDSSGSIRDNNPSDYSYDNWALVLQFVSRVNFRS